MPLRDAVICQDPDAYATALELREEHRFMRRSKREPPVENKLEDAVIALVDYHRAQERLMSGGDSVPPSRVERRGAL